MKIKRANIIWLLRVLGSYEVLMLFSAMLFAQAQLAVSAYFISYLICNEYNKLSIDDKEDSVDDN